MAEKTQKIFININKNQSKEILLYLLVGGAIVVALSTAPYLLASAVFLEKDSKSKKDKKKVRNSFSYLKRKDLIKIESKRGKTHIMLTKKGTEKAKKHQVETLNIKKPRKWDKKWRVVLFDIKAEQKIKREALRHLLKRMGFQKLQKSVWIHAFDCSGEVNFLKKFFDMSDDELRLIVAGDIGRSKLFKKAFGV